MKTGFWAELLLLSTLLLICGEFLLLFLRRAWPSLRHRFILFVFLGLAALPALLILVPQVPLPSWHRDATSKAFVMVTEVPSHIGPGAAQGSIDWLLSWW